MKNVVKFFGIPMSSLGGVHLISGTAQCVRLTDHFSRHLNQVIDHAPVSGCFL